MRTSILAAGLLAAASVGPAGAQDIVRHRTPGSNFPIAMAVEVPAGATTVMVSGMVPAVADTNAPRNSLASFAGARSPTPRHRVPMSLPESEPCDPPTTAADRRHR